MRATLVNRAIKVQGFDSKVESKINKFNQFNHLDQWSLELNICKKIKTRLVLISSLLSVSALAQKATSSTGDFAMDLGHVYAGVKSTKHLEELCTQYFPNTKTANEAAYTEWRKSQLELIQELEKKWTMLAWEASNGKQEDYAEILSNSHKEIAKLKTAMEAQMNEQQDSFQSLCDAFPEYLKSERMNLEHFYSEQIETIRSKESYKIHKPLPQNED